ncbi:MAG: Nif3-like dinuclear metal center hexameric protein [Sedimentisphaerales bacterium]|nr:Nif3-like dinuclear metal center hexameric protein [Sedimentisphaerales bacterium]
MVVLHLHDALHIGMPDAIQQTLMKVMGWENNINLDAGRNFFELAPISLAKLAQEIAEKFNTRTIRVEGDPEMIVKNVMTSLGNAGADRCVPALGRDDVDAFIFGETDEWESAGYVLDAIKAGRKKALIYIGHMESEQPGMKHLAEQMKEYVTEVPVEFITLPELFWRTDNPVWEFEQLS